MLSARFEHQNKLKINFSLNQIQFTSTENVLLYVEENSNLSSLEFNQEGCSKVASLKYGNRFGDEYFFVWKEKLATLNFTTTIPDDCLNFFEIENICTEDFNITFKSNYLKCCPSMRLSFCAVDDLELKEKDEKKKDHGFEFKLSGETEQLFSSGAFSFGSENPFNI